MNGRRRLGLWPPSPGRGGPPRELPSPPSLSSFALLPLSLPLVWFWISLLPVPSLSILVVAYSLLSPLLFLFAFSLLVAYVRAHVGVSGVWGFGSIFC